MSRLVGWFASNPVAANLLMALVVVAGLLSMSTLRQETFPTVAFDTIGISIAYPGAAPDEVEEAVCVPIEEAIHGVRGVQRVSARAIEGHGSVWAELAVGADAQRVQGDIQTRIDALALPDEVKRPIVRELLDDSVLLGISIHGDVDERTLRLVGERVRDEVGDLAAVDRAELVGVREYEIAIEVSEAALRRYGLSFDDVAGAVRGASVDLPGGSLKTRGGEILMRADGRARRGPEFARLVLVTRVDGSRVRLGDVARVSDGFAESDERLRFDGEPAVMVRLLESGLDDVLEASRAVRTYIDELAPRLPAGVAIGIWSDESLDFASRRDLLVRNGLQGLALIFAILALFLRPRLAFWVTLGIPTAFLGAMIGLSLTGASINMMSMFAFIVALGLVVDDAIIVGENVARHQERSSDRLAGAISGARGVMLPVLIAVLTTMLFIAPDLTLPTPMGKVAYSLGVVVIGCLFFSLVESLLVLPAHLAPRHMPPWRRLRSAGRFFERVQSRVDAWLQGVVARHYRPFLERALRRPGLTLSTALALLLVSLGAVAGGWIPRAFFPHIEVDYVSVRVVMPEGTAPEVVSAAVRHLEERAIEVGRELEVEEGNPIFAHVLTAIGDRPDHHDSFATGGEGPNVGHVGIQLVPGEQRSATSFEVKERWRERAGSIPGARSVVYRGSEFSWNRPIDVALSSADPEALSAAAAELVAALKATPGVREIADSESGGKQELSLRIRPEAEAMGLTLAEVARQVRQGFHGEEVQRLHRGREEVAVVVRYPRSERRSIADLENVRIRLPDGAALPFSAVAGSQIASGYAAIERRDRRRTVRVSADVDYDVTGPAAVLAGLAERDFPRIAVAHPGVSFDLDGQSRDETEITKALERGFLLALVAAYALLAVTMGSYLQPLLILVAIPFGFVGAVAAHAVLGLQISAFSLIGLIALTGVVVNDALLLIDRANRRRSEGASAVDALLEAGATRFRPILLTSLTTFFGLLPLLFEGSAQAEWLKPMAATLAFGVMVATFITLLIVPAAYVVLEALVDTASRAALRGDAELAVTPSAESPSYTAAG